MPLTPEGTSSSPPRSRAASAPRSAAGGTPSRDDLTVRGSAPAAGVRGWAPGHGEHAAQVVPQPGEHRGVVEGQRHGRAAPTEQRDRVAHQRVTQRGGELGRGQHDDPVVPHGLGARSGFGRVWPGAQDVTAALAVVEPGHQHRRRLRPTRGKYRERTEYRAGPGPYPDPEPTASATAAPAGDHVPGTLLVARVRGVATAPVGEAAPLRAGEEPADLVEQWHGGPPRTTVRQSVDPGVPGGVSVMRRYRCRCLR